MERSLAAGQSEPGVKTLPARRLKVGLLWQYEHTQLDPRTATALHMQAVVRSLSRRGHTVRVITNRMGRPHCSSDLEHWEPVNTPDSAPSNGERRTERLVRGVQSRLHLPYLNYFESRRFAHGVVQAAADCDVLYERFFLQSYGGLLAGRRLGIPIFYEVNGDLVEEYNSLGIKLSRAQWAAVNRITKWMFTKAGRVITVTPALRERTIQRWDIPAHKVTAVENGADVELFSQAARAGAAQKDIPARYGLDGGQVIMYVGSFQPWHGVDLLVASFERLVKDFPQARLALVGDGKARPAVAAQVQQAGLAERVVFTGAVPHPEVSALLAAAAIAVLSHRETPASLSNSPLKLFEYMAAGKAIVAPDLANMTAVLRDGETACLYPPEDVTALTQALGKLLADPLLRQALGERACRQAVEKHSWGVTAEHLEAIFLAELDK